MTNSLKAVLFTSLCLQFLNLLLELVSEHLQDIQLHRIVVISVDGVTFLDEVVLHFVYLPPHAIDLLLQISVLHVQLHLSFHAFLHLGCLFQDLLLVFGHTDTWRMVRNSH